MTFSPGTPIDALVFGARGQLGRALLPRLRDRRVLAAGRAAVDGVPWMRCDLFSDVDTLRPAELVFSLGPLDGFARWFERSARAPRRVVAFGSTSVHAKQDSPVPAERALAARLAEAEAVLQRACAERGSALTVLRPTLVYGLGLDRNLTRIAQLARRWRVFPLPRDATGLRQPVHVDDLADAALAAAAARGPLASAYDLPGGEALPYKEMVRRVLASLDPPAKLLELPSGPLRAAGWCAHRVGLMGDAGAGVWARLATDLVFDAQPARRDLGYAPREFSPTACMFDAARALLQRTM